VIAAALSKVNGFLQRIKATAEQLSSKERWRLILSAAFQYFLRGKVLGATGRLAEATG
jgi:ABC-type Zn uptake system ZnuABC Zn-binding protein ZnuA